MASLIITGSHRKHATESIPVLKILKSLYNFQYSQYIGGVLSFLVHDNYTNSFRYKTIGSVRELE